MSADIPTQADFQLLPRRKYDPDHCHTWEHFGGRTLDEAYVVFRENPLRYPEDLMWMVPKPFCFYLPVALRYLQSAEASGDSDIISCLASDIEFHFSCGHDIQAAFPCIQAICDYVLSHYSEYDVIEEIYGNLRPRCEGLRKKTWEQGAV